MPGRLLRFLALSAKDKGLLLQSCWYIMAVRASLSLRGFKFTREKISSFTSARSGRAGAAPVPVCRIRWAVESVSRRFPGATCLVNALAGMILLQKNGYSPELQIGVSRAGERSLDAHAWVTLDGEIVIGKLPDMCHLKPLPINER